jgi:hypothetical protein
MSSIKITKILSYSYTIAKHTTTIKKGSMKHSRPLDLAILLFSHSSIRLCKSALPKWSYLFINIMSLLETRRLC